MVSLRRRQAQEPAADTPAQEDRTQAHLHDERPVRRRGAGAAVVGTFAAAVLGLARLVMTLAALIALLIGIAIVLHDVGANPSNSVVKGLHEGANFFAGSFTGLVRIKDHADRELTLDWGIALVVYLVVGAVLSRLIAGLAPRRPVVSRSRRGAAPSY